MNSKLNIWNMALGFIGTRTISTEDERTLEAIQCGLYWDNARRSALRDYPWNFARRRASLAEISLPSGYEHEFTHAYALPNDLLHALKIYPNWHDYNALGANERARFMIVHDANNKQGILLCNTAKCLLAYTADIEDCNMFDDLFTHMLARKLAALIAVPLLKNNPAKVQELEQLYRAAIPNAMQADANEGKEQASMDSWILARGESYAYK